MDELKFGKGVEENDTLDVVQIGKTLWKKIWVIFTAGVLAAVLFFSYSFFLVTPKYSSSVQLYVNSTVSVGNLSTSVLTAARDLVKTYISILNTRTTIEKVAEEAGVDYSYGQLKGMISASAVSETEIFQITVTARDPREAAKIANTIADVLPDRVADIIDGCSVRLVDSAVVSTSKVSPNIVKNTGIGFLIGILLACGIIIVMFLLDDTIYSEEYLLRAYDIPVLAKIPNLLEDEKDRYGYKKYYQSESVQAKKDK